MAKPETQNQSSCRPNLSNNDGQTIASQGIKEEVSLIASQGIKEEASLNDTAAKTLLLCTEKMDDEPSLLDVAEPDEPVPEPINLSEVLRIA